MGLTTRVAVAYFRMHGSAQPGAPFPTERTSASLRPADPTPPGNSNGQSLGEQELEAALQLLVERAQYITGATGVALALPSGKEMVCRASAGISAPPVGARLQVQSGLTGESIARRQLLRCDNAENDPRVNLETCREMGIASIVVLPLLRQNGEICGLFELFSDHAYAFEDRDLSALDHLANLTLTALDLAEDRPGSVAGFIGASVAARGVPPAEAATENAESPAITAGVEAAEAEQKIDSKLDQQPGQGSDQSLARREVEAAVPLSEESMPAESVADSLPEGPPAVAAAVPLPEAMGRVQKCAACGFPVSEGRTYCLDCERKEGKPSVSSESVTAEFVPSFLTASAPPEESWLGDHVNLLAIIVLILGILLAVVVFR
jgi:putative methionine-R-sulfoxide reductase with GAF domain